MQLSTGVAGWTDAITEIAELFMNGEVQWFTSAPTTYSASAGTGGTPTETTIATTPARIQHIREPQSVGTSTQWTEYRRIRCQIPSANLSDAIVKGVKGRITDGGQDPRLVGLVLVVEDARNSSWAAIRTVEAIVESVGP